MKDKGLLVSIIIPTLNRAQYLEKTLSALLQNEFKEGKYEIIVVDSSNNTESKKLIAKFLKKKSEIRYLKNSIRSIPKSKNLGITASRGKLLIFLDDDILVKIDFIHKHFQSFIQTNGITMGSITLDKAILATNFGKYINSGTFVRSDSQIQKQYFFHTTANLSLPKKNLSNELFDEKFNLYGYEDLELGWRLYKKGYNITINPKINVLHIHINSPQEFYQKKYQAGQNLVRLINKHPELKNHLFVPNQLILSVLPLFTLPVTVLRALPDKLLGNLSYKLILGYYYCKGFKSGLNNGKSL